MYATFSDFLREIFGINIPLPIQTFGLMMGLAFAAAFITAVSELKRKEGLGLLHSTKIKVWINKKATSSETFLAVISWSFIGFKALEGVLNYQDLVNNPQEFILSMKGNVVGLILGAVYGYYTIYSANQKLKDKEPKEIEKEMFPHNHMWNILFIGAITGILGAKIFHNLENFDELMADPINALISFSGLTFYGGLILAAASIIYYARKNNINPLHLSDAIAPGLMLAYGIGRIGCHLSGDGDWGIVNSAYMLNGAGDMFKAAPGYFESSVLPLYNNYYTNEFGAVQNVKAVYFEGFSFLPDWFWAFNYHNNVINAGVQMSVCNSAHCYMLPNPVFPTALWEAVTCIILFALLWKFRTKFTKPGTLISFYMIINGIERFFIEKIRVNTTYNIFGIHPTQAELISIALILVGGMMYFYFKNRKPKSISIVE
ncbi:MAG: prolipoprotein diacylglyceryl transferase family protein [Bacteroidota bacterium]